MTVLRSGIVFENLINRHFRKEKSILSLSLAEEMTVGRWRMAGLRSEISFEEMTDDRGQMIVLRDEIDFEEMIDDRGQMIVLRDGIVFVRMTVGR